MIEDCATDQELIAMMEAHEIQEAEVALDHLNDQVGNGQDEGDIPDGDIVIDQGLSL